MLFLFKFNCRIFVLFIIYNILFIRLADLKMKKKVYAFWVKVIVVLIEI